MAAEPNTLSLDTALLTVAESPGRVLDFINTFARSKALVVADRPWDGRSVLDRNMRLILVSDGPNEKQVMLAMFTNSSYVNGYLQSLGNVRHNFKYVLQMDVAPLMLSLPFRAGIMLNPNSDRSFRISPEVAAGLKKAAQLSLALSTLDARRQRREPPAPLPGSAHPDIENKVAIIEDTILAGNLDEAEKRIDELPKTSEYSSYVLSSKAMHVKAKGDYQTAIQLTLEALQNSADSRLAARLWSQLGHLFEDSQNLDEAEIAYFNAQACEPTRVRYVLDTARVLVGQHRLNEALLLLRKAVAAFPSDAEPGMHLGTMLVENGDQEAALEAYDAAIAIDPASAALHFNRALCLQMLGHMNDARIAYEHALRLDPTLDGYNQYVQLRKFTSSDAENSEPFLQLQRRRTESEMPLSTRIDSNFALAKIYDSLGDIDRSFEYLNTANQLKRSAMTYSNEDTTREIDRIIETYDREFFQKYSNKAASELAPIFILGMPRSGTTLTEQILAAHSKIHTGGELTHLASLAFQFSRQRYGGKQVAEGQEADIVSELQHIASGYASRTSMLQKPGKRFTDKMPGNFLHVGLIYLLFPNATVIHCYRNPIDTCLSCYERLFTKSLIFSYDQTELGQYYRNYLRLMRHWHEVLPKDFILDLEYEKLIADSETEIKHILDFCKLDFEERCLDFHNVKRSVTTASALQVRQPLYNTSVNRWKKYENKLGALIAALGSDVSGFGG